MKTTLTITKRFDAAFTAFDNYDYYDEGTEVEVTATVDLINEDGSVRAEFGTILKVMDVTTEVPSPFDWEYLTYDSQENIEIGLEAEALALQA